MIGRLPSDILDIVHDMLALDDILSVNLCSRQKLLVKSVQKKIGEKLEKHTFRYRQKCVACSHQCLTEMTYEDGFVRQWIPYCAIHCPALLMNDIQVYCTGGIDVNGTPLILHYQTCEIASNSSSD